MTPFLQYKKYHNEHLCTFAPTQMWTFLKVLIESVHTIHSDKYCQILQKCCANSLRYQVGMKLLFPPYPCQCWILLIKIKFLQSYSSYHFKLEAIISTFWILFFINGFSSLIYFKIPVKYTMRSATPRYLPKWNENLCSQKSNIYICVYVCKYL